MQRVDASAAALAAALRAHDTLTALSMSTDGVAIAASAEALLRALEGHASVRALQLHDESGMLDNNAGVAAALGALVSADAPALEELHIHALPLEAALAPLLGGLAANTHLRVLRCRSYADVDEDYMNFGSSDDDDDSPAAAHAPAADSLPRRFVRDALLPALRANASLRELALDDALGVQHAEAAPAVELVRRRGGRGGRGCCMRLRVEGACAPASMAGAKNE
jgi:hypothetical protein